MKFYVSLAFICLLLPAVCGLRCFTCRGVNPGTCDEIWTCPAHYDRCATTIVAQNLIYQECMRSDICNIVRSNGVMCCSGDLCNRGEHTGVFVPLLLAPLAIITLFV